jgi:hypothetical protein
MKKQKDLEASLRMLECRSRFKTPHSHHHANETKSLKSKQASKPWYEADDRFVYVPILYSDEACARERNEIYLLGLARFCLCLSLSLSLSLSVSLSLSLSGGVCVSLSLCEQGSRRASKGSPPRKCNAP